MDQGHLYNGDVAAYVDGTLSSDDRERIEAHLAACDECTEEVAAVFKEVHAGLPKRRRWRIGAAALIAAALAGIWLFGPSSLGLGSGQAPVLRNGQQATPFELEILRPADGSEAAVDSVLFEWRSAGSGASYTLTVTDESGDIVWQQATDDTSLTLMPRTAEVVLRSGQIYYWYVDALLDGGESVTTGVHEFRTVGRPG